MGVKFLCDAMLGKLARYLRLMGLDTEYDKDGSGKGLLLSARSENRILLTRNRRLLVDKAVFLVNSERPEEQLRSVIAGFRLRCKAKFFSRCLVCNRELVPVSKDEVAGRVPYYTYKHFDRYSLCPQCQRIYWAGSHHHNMKKRIDRILKERRDRDAKGLGRRVKGESSEDRSS